MEDSETKLTELQSTILDGMADDYEDVEQLYLYTTCEFSEEKPVANIQPSRFPLRDIVDEIMNMLREGYIKAKYSNDKELAPLHPLNFSALHHYWFGATDKGMHAWKAYRADEPKR
jgi:hypothetical protein